MTLDYHSLKFGRQKSESVLPTCEKQPGSKCTSMILFAYMYTRTWVSGHMQHGVGRVRADKRTIVEDSVHVHIILRSWK